MILLSLANRSRYLTNMQKIAHRLEIQTEKYGANRVLPENIPKHPSVDSKVNISKIATYADLKFRWNKWKKNRVNDLRVSREWKVRTSYNPQLHYRWKFFKHDKNPSANNIKIDPTTIVPDISTAINGVLPTKILEPTNHNQFAVVKLSNTVQQKVTIGDIIQIQAIQHRAVGDEINFSTVLAYGTSKISIIGFPTIPFISVKTVVEENTMTRPDISLIYRSRKRNRNFVMTRRFVCMLKVTGIKIDINPAKLGLSILFNKYQPNNVFSTLDKSEYFIRARHLKDISDIGSEHAQHIKWLLRRSENQPIQWADVYHAVAAGYCTQRLIRPKSVLERWANRPLTKKETRLFKTDKAGIPELATIHQGTDISANEYYRNRVGNEIKVFPDMDWEGLPTLEDSRFNNRRRIKTRPKDSPISGTYQPGYT